MQISRHWRLNSQRYRLEGFRNSNGEVDLQNRPQYPADYYEQLIQQDKETEKQKRDVIKSLEAIRPAA